MTPVIRVFDQARGAEPAPRGVPEGALMATEVKLPRLGQGMESGVIVRWLKAEGDAVSSGEPLYELDTDKVTQEVEAEVDGVLLQIVVAEGEVAVGSTVAVIGRTATRRRASRAEPESAADAEAESEPAAKEPAGARGRRTPRRSDETPAPDVEAETAAGRAAPQPSRGRAPTCGSRPRRSRAGSRASAGSTSRR